VRNYPMHYDSTGHPPDASAPAVSDNLPEQFVLHQNYPNPFNPSTIIQFDLIQRTNITLKIYNILGQEVLTLLNTTPLSPGVHRIHFDGSNLPSGIYIYRLETPNFSSSRKMVLLK
ncbi:T9SS type A sorting domain-containing protein, partial [bacterium]|nr:T9SS type A sorting domain-containing protein [bacterium]